MLNRIALMGRFTADPELKYTPQGTAVCTFALACERDFGANGEKKTDFFNCMAWRKTAEFIAQYLQKGALTVVAGRLQNREWEDRDHNRRKVTEIVVETAYFAGSKKESHHEEEKSEWDSLGEEINVNAAEPTYTDEIPF